MIEKFICQLDHFVRNPGGVFLFGWALHPKYALESAVLELVFADGSLECVDVELNKAREDVAFAFAKHPYAANSGFLAIAGLPHADLCSATIEFLNVEGERDSCELVIPTITQQSNPKSWRYLVRRAVAYVRLGKLSLVIKKARSFQFAELLRLKNGDANTIATRISGRSCRLVVDHAMGGGANIYRETRVSEWLANDEFVVLLTFRLDSMSYIVSASDASSETHHAISDLDELSNALGTSRIEEVFFNCGVSFPRAINLQRFMLEIVRRHSARLVIAVHEYFLVCPSNFLLDNKGNYCGIPEIDRCEQCLPAHRDGFVSLTGIRSITAWRKIWGEVLAAASEILCFSNSSLQLLERAYPKVAGRVEVRPHAVPMLRSAKLRIPRSDSLVVGIIGSISDHKGAKVIAGLADAIIATKAAVRIVVIGSLDRQHASPVVDVTGSFSRNELPGLVEDWNVDVAFLPSICPETFSFVAHEIVAMGIPLIAFNLGAQADVVKNQKVGLIVESTDSITLLHEIISFKNSLNTCLR